MKKFIVLYHSPKGAWEKMGGASPEDMKKGMEPWMAWAKRCGSGLVDMGSPLGNAQKIGKKGSSSSQSTVIGYSVLQASSMDKTLQMLKGHPHIEWMDGCEIEVHEALPLPGM